jgi:hypothetical protein
MPTIAADDRSLCEWSKEKTADVGAPAVYHVRGNQLPHQGKRWFPSSKEDSLLRTFVIAI